MKKVSVAILAVFYLSTSMSATVHLHYCMGKLVEWSLWHSSGKTCSKCGMEKPHKNLKDGCCKDEQKLIKNDKDQKLTETAFNLIHLTSVAVPTSQIEIPALQISSIAEANPVSNAPPRRQVAIHIRNCVFLI